MQTATADSKKKNVRNFFLKRLMWIQLLCIQIIWCITIYIGPIGFLDRDIEMIRQKQLDKIKQCRIFRQFTLQTSMGCPETKYLGPLGVSVTLCPISDSEGIFCIFVIFIYFAWLKSIKFLIRIISDISPK